MGKTSELLKNIFEQNWSEVFIFDSIKGKTITYEDFFKSVLNCKNVLEKTGVKKGDKICLIINNSTELVTLYFASLVMRAIVVPIDPNKGQIEIEDILSQVKTSHIITDSAILAERYSGLYLDTIAGSFCCGGSVQKTDLDILDTIDYNSVYLITFTSGSTGIPKGVMHSFSNLVESALAFKARFPLNSASIFYHNLPMTYMAGILNLLILPFVSGSKVVMDERFTVSKILRFWEIPLKYQVNTFWFIPTILVLLLEMDRDTKAITHFRNKKSIGFVGTAPLNLEAGNRFQEKYGINLYPSYGLSETLFVSTTHPPLEHLDGTVGQVLEKVSLLFAEDQEILIEVPWMFQGYYNIDCNQFFQNKTFRSGDLGFFDSNGRLIITGRKKDLIIRGGINISPKRIEDFINTAGFFRECVILGLKNYSMGEKTGCFYVSASPLSSENKNEINRSIVKELGRDYCIDEFFHLDAIPKNLNGKVDKQKILQSFPGTSL